MSPTYEEIERAIADTEVRTLPRLDGVEWTSLKISDLRVLVEAAKILVADKPQDQGESAGVDMPDSHYRDPLSQ